jgi:acyl-CoA reductase-like NAD-dependent aldehyde dehydrogenase
VVAKKVAAFRQGASVNGGCFDVGSMTMPRQLEIVDELVQAAIQDGAKVLAGAKRDEKPGLFYRCARASLSLTPMQADKLR